MMRRLLGRSGPQVSAIGLGCMGMSQFYGPWNDAESIRVLHRAVDLGVTLFDTADMYGPYLNERLLGRALRGHRDQVLIATKFGNVKGPDGRVVRVDGRPEYVRAACDGSLRRLGVDHLDVYCQHRVDVTVPVEETWGALAELVAAGKVRYLAISEASVATVRRAHAVHPMVAVQTEYSLFTRAPEATLLPALRELGIGLIAYAPLGRGLLTEPIAAGAAVAADDFRRTLPRFTGANRDRNGALARRLLELATARQITLPQLALAWALAAGEDVVPIPGTKRLPYLEQNVAAADIVLSQVELARLDQLMPAGVAAGERYPDMSTVDL